MALNDWESLSMRERALYIRQAVANGLHTTEDIRQSYNEFKKGGPEETRKQTFLSSLEKSLRNNSRYNTPEWRKYLTDLAGRESGYRPNITNSIGAKGYFQLMPFNRASQWTTPTQQFEEMFKMSDANMKWFKKNLTKQDLQKAEELGIDIYGLMAGAHLGGVKGVVRALRGTSNAKDMNGTSVLNYMTSFSQSPRNTSINYTMPVSYPQEIVQQNNYQPFNYTLMDSNEGNVPKNIQVVEEQPIQKQSSNIIVEEEPQVNPLDIIASVQNTVPSITTYNTPRPLIATEILAQREADRNTLLAKEFENSLLRNNLLGIEEDNNIFQEGGKVWKALSNIKYQVIPDTTFTKDKTGAGDIEYFSAQHPEGITYNNGYHKKHPSPGNDVILYNPNTNDTQDIMLDALHIMPKDATYDVLNSIYRNAAKDSDVAYNAKLRYTEDAKKYGVNNIDSYQTYFNNEADGLLRNMFIEGSPEYIESKRYYPDKQKLRQWNKQLLPHIDAIQNYLETGIRPLNILPEVVIQGNKHKKKFEHVYKK